MNLKPPYMTYDDIREASEKFLGEYHATRELPIPIDAIAEFELGIQIRPLPGLYRCVSVNGFLTSDLKYIVLDKTQFEEYEQKYRFTVAHEIGHFVLHRECYESVDFTSLSQFKDFYESVDAHEMGWFETQASWFAELALVPTTQLQEICRTVVSERASDIKKLGDLTPSVWSYLAHDIARPFNVSPGVVECRLTRTGIKDARLADLF